MTLPTFLKLQREPFPVKKLYMSTKGRAFERLLKGGALKATFAAA